MPTFSQIADTVKIYALLLPSIYSRGCGSRTNREENQKIYFRYTFRKKKRWASCVSSLKFVLIKKNMVISYSINYCPGWCKITGMGRNENLEISLYWPASIIV